MIFLPGSIPDAVDLDATIYLSIRRYRDSMKLKSVVDPKDSQIKLPGVIAEFNELVFGDV